MDPARVIPAHDWLSQPWEAPLLVVLAILAIGLGVVLVRLNRLRPRDVYDPQRAWLRGGLYFCFCFFAGWATGVLPRLVTQPMATAAQLTDPVWIAATIAWFAVIAFGYGWVWRRGTLHYERPLVLTAVLPFGVLWGLSGGLILLSYWSLAEMIGAPRWGAALAVYLLGGTLNGLWHAKYWDNNVSPDHNIKAQNQRKILLAHTPNLIASLAHMFAFGNPALFVLAQTLALLTSTMVMHFPPFWGPAAAPRPRHDGAGR